MKYSNAILADFPVKVYSGATLGWDIIREASASLITAKLYPLGMLEKRFPIIPSWSRRDQAVPILFIHGIFHNWTAFTYLAQRLAWDGWSDFYEIRLFTSVESIPKMAKRTAAHAHAILKETGAPKIDIVAHSMGGIVARYFVQLLGGDEVVRHLITLGTPHQGTPVSNYSPLPHIKKLAPESRILQRLNALPAPQQTQGLAIRGKLDVFTQNRAGWWPGVRNVELGRVGHAGLLFSRRVYQLVSARISDELGHSVPRVV